MDAGALPLVILPGLCTGYIHYLHRIVVYGMLQIHTLATSLRATLVVFVAMAAARRMEAHNEHGSTR
jgi:hypothetical protein